jgi:hypothetical protein
MPRTEEALDAILRSLAAQGRAGLQVTTLDRRASFDRRAAEAMAARPLPPLPASAATSVHRVKVSLRGARPPVWRRLEVPSDLPLSVLHEVIQTAFGWFDCHLHQFETACGDFGDPAQDDFWSRRADESAAVLAQVAGEAKSAIAYVYDFGDDWRHDLVVEAVVPATPGVRYPRCLASRGAPPEEDSGGIAAFNSRPPGTASGPVDTAESLTSQLAGLAGVVVPPATPGP